jgi:hypothetical protein
MWNRAEVSKHDIVGVDQFVFGIDFATEKSPSVGPGTLRNRLADGMRGCVLRTRVRVESCNRTVQQEMILVNRYWGGGCG